MDSNKINVEDSDIYKLINKILIALPIYNFQILSKSDDYKDIITGIQYKLWSNNLKKYSNLVFQINYGYINNLDRVIIQKLANLTGQTIYTNNDEIIPITQVKASDIIKTKNFLNNNLSKEKFKNALYLISKFPITLDMLDLSTENEYNEIIKLISIVKMNDNNLFNEEYINNDFEKKNFIYFSQLKMNTQLIIILKIIDLLYQWLINNSNFKSLNFKINKVKNILIDLHILARNIKKKLYDNNYYDDNMLLNIEKNISITSTNLYKLMYNDMFSIYSNIININSLEYIDTIIISKNIIKNLLDLDIDETFLDIYQKKMITNTIPTLNKTVELLRKSLNLL